MATESVTILDGLGRRIKLAAESRAGIFTTHSAPEIGGSAVTTSNPLPVASFTGGTGTDYSTSSVVILDGYVRVTSALTDVNRAYIGVQNQDDAPIQVVRSSDGFTYDSIIQLEPLEMWESRTFKGALIVFAASEESTVSMFAD